MRRLHIRWKVFACGIEESQTAGLRRFVAALEHPLHADANAEKGRVADDCGGDGIPKSCALQIFGRRKMSHARKDDPVSGRDEGWISGDCALLAKPVERLLDGHRITRSV